MKNIRRTIDTPAVCLISHEPKHSQIDVLNLNLPSISIPFSVVDVPTTLPSIAVFEISDATQGIVSMKNVMIPDLQFLVEQAFCMDPTDIIWILRHAQTPEDRTIVLNKYVDLFQKKFGRDSNALEFFSLEGVYSLLIYIISYSYSIMK